MDPNMFRGVGTAIIAALVVVGLVALGVGVLIGRYI